MTQNGHRTNTPSHIEEEDTWAKHTDDLNRTDLSVIVTHILARKEPTFGQLSTVHVTEVLDSASHMTISIPSIIFD